MAITPVKPVDPFDFPKSMAPLGLTYQWSAPTICGQPSPQHQKLLEAGWVAVPAQWHAPYPVEVQNNVLLCHARAKDEEAGRIEGAQRNIDNWIKNFGGKLSGGFRIVTQDERGVSPMLERRIGNPVIADRVIETTMPLPAPKDMPVLAAPTTKQTTRVPRRPWLAKLFNLISKEIET